NRMAYAGIALVFVLSTIATLPLAPPLVPKLYAVFQHPFRFLAGAALPGAILVAYGLAPLEDRLKALIGEHANAALAQSSLSILAVLAIGLTMGWSSRVQTDAPTP